jgi:hypothetical protein
MPSTSEQNPVAAVKGFRRSTVCAALVVAAIASGVLAQGLEAQNESARDKGLREVGFTSRAHSVQGEFLTEAQIADRHPMQMTDLFTDVRGVRVDYSSGYPMLTASTVPASQPRVDNSSGYPMITATQTPTGGCVSFIVDGKQTSVPDPTDFNKLLHPADVAAIEVYTPAQTPNEFRNGSDANCEVIVIWTRKKVGG